MKKHRDLAGKIRLLLNDAREVSFISKVLKCSPSLVRYHMKKRDKKMAVKFREAPTSEIKSLPMSILGVDDKPHVGKPWDEAAKALRAKAVEFLDCANKLEKLANGGGGL